MVGPDYLHYLQTISIFCSRFRGLRILSEQVRKAFVRTEINRITCRFDSDIKFHCDLQDHIGSYIFWRGMYSRDVLDVLGRILREKHTFIDVGANQGEFTLFAAKRLRDGSVIAFEPMASLCERLARNLRLNGFHNVQIVKKALGEKPDRRPIRVPRGRFHDGSVNSGLPSLYSMNTDGDRTEIIDVTTLDAYVKHTQPTRIDVIKIDIEGSELPMLRGAAQTMESFRPTLIVELSRETARAAGYESEDIVQFISLRKYRIDRILPGGTTQPLEAEPLANYQNVICYPL